MIAAPGRMKIRSGVLRFWGHEERRHPEVPAQRASLEG